MRSICLSVLFVVGAASGVSAAPDAVKPQQTSGQSASFHALNKIQSPRPLSHQQLAAIEGAGSAKGGVTWPLNLGRK